MAQAEVLVRLFLEQPEGWQLDDLLEGSAVALSEQATSINIHLCYLVFFGTLMHDKSGQHRYARLCFAA